MIRKWLLGIVREAMKREGVSPAREMTLVIRADTTDVDAKLQALEARIERFTEAVKRASESASLAEET